MVNNAKEFEKNMFLSIGVLGFIGGIICLTPNITGNVIGELSKSSSSLMGIALIFLGFAAIWIANIRE